VVTGRVALALVAGAGCGLGVLIVVAGMRGAALSPAAVRTFDPRRLQRYVVALVAGLAVLAVTRWVAVAAAMVLLVVLHDRLFGGSGRARRSIARLEALASWTESLRDMIATGVALPEALMASVDAASPVIRPHLVGLNERLAAREPVEDALRALADELDDAGADLTVAALVLNARAQGRALQAVLSELARCARAELGVRRAIEAERRSTRRAVQFVVGATLVTALGLAVGNPSYVAPYRSTAGQLVLAIVVGIFAVGFAWLARLSAMPAPRRFLTGSSAMRPSGVR
jgi:Flp pilus assembly protein TadB